MELVNGGECKNMMPNIDEQRINVCCIRSFAVRDKVSPDDSVCPLRFIPSFMCWSGLCGALDHLRSDNVSEFIAYALQDWLREYHRHTPYITPRSPWENPFIESFNGTFRNE